MGRVSIVRSAKAPKDAEIKGLVKKSIDLVGCLGSVVKKGDVVALKPNVVTGRVSKPGVLTDKRIIEAMITLCQEAGASEVQVVEGSGYFTPTDEALEKSGVKAAAEALGASVVNVDKDELIEIPVPGHIIIDKIQVSKSFMGADVRINMPVMKTHDQLLVTLGVKNLKGVIPKTWKRIFHRIGLGKG